ncbi:alpha/beta fold hydrolase [Coraliomargarita sp. W4R53]
MQILALHGFTGCGSDFAPCAELVGGQWHCPDLPGHCDHLKLDCSPQATVDYIQQQLPTCHSSRPTPQRILLGYSMGARAALQHATQYPAAWEALILISANPGIETEAERAQRRSADAKLADSIQVKGVPEFLEFWQQTPLIRNQQKIPDDWRKTMQSHRLKHTARGLANSLWQFGQGSCPNLWPQISKLKMPVCLITGERDSKYTNIAKRMLPELRSPLSTHAEIKDASHMPHLEAAEASAKVMKRFLNSL